jgi:hypothetical protein
MIPNRKTLVFIGLLVIAGTVQAATSITTCPFVITSPGDYVLRADLICGGGDGITIKSSNVTLALEGHTITAGVGATRAIVASAGFPNGPSLFQNISILGPGLITNGGGNAFSAGVFLLFVVNSEVNGLTVLGSGNGIVADESTSLTITANTLGRNVIGMDLGNAFLCTISDNDVSGNGTGIQVVNDGGLGSVGTVSHNIINGNTGAGILILAANGATFQNNVTNGNGQYGIFVTGPLGPPVNGVDVTNNRSLANGTFDLFDGSAVCAGAVWSSNTFFTANQSCIH